MLKEGDIIELQDGETVYANIPERLRYVNRPDSNELTYAEVRIGSEAAPPAGRYVVYKTALHGGGTGHGPHDVYPDGHHVFCEKLDDSRIRLDFYQSGCFTVVKPDIKPVGRARRQWVEE